MSISRTLPANGKVDEGDIAANRVQVNLARHLRALQSWSAQPDVGDAAGQGQEAAAAERNDEDTPDALFEGMGEADGVGSRTSREDIDSAVADFTSRKPRASMDKLLEQMIGKKAARARRNAREIPSAGGCGLHSAAPTEPAIKASVGGQEEEHLSEDEEGRAALISSRKHTARRGGSVTTPVLATKDVNEESDPHRSRKPPEDTRIEEQHPPKKRKPQSYMDEIMEQKALKKAKRKMN